MEKNEKTACVFIFQKYGKFWSILLEHFIKHKPLISEEWKGSGLNILLFSNVILISFIIWLAKNHLFWFKILQNYAFLCNLEKNINQIDYSFPCKLSNNSTIMNHTMYFSSPDFFLFFFLKKFWQMLMLHNLHFEIIVRILCIFKMFFSHWKSFFFVNFKKMWIHFMTFIPIAFIYILHI